MFTASDPNLNTLPDYLENSTSFYAVVVDMQGNYAHVNKLFRQRFSYISKDFIGHSIIETIHQNSYEACANATLFCISNPGKSTAVKILKPRKNGGYYWTNWDFTLLTNQQQQPAGIMCIGYDISEAEQTKEALEIINSDFNEIFENCLDGLVTIDRNWNIIKHNYTVLELLGNKDQPIIGRCFWDIFPDSPDYQFPAELRKVMSDRITVSFEEYIYSIHTWFNVVAHPTNNGITIFFKKTNALHESYEKLKEAELKLEAIINSTTDLNILIDSNLNILNFNKAVEAFVLNTMGKTISRGENFRAFVLPQMEQTVIDAIEKAFNGIIVTLEKEIQFPNNTVLWHKLFFSPAYNKQNEIIGVVFNVTDITESKLFESRLLKQNELLRQITFSQNHEVRRPLDNILAILELFKSKLSAKEKEAYLDLLQTSSVELDIYIKKIVAAVNEAMKEHQV